MNYLGILSILFFIVVVFILCRNYMKEGFDKGEKWRNAFVDRIMNDFILSGKNDFIL